MKKFFVVMLICIMALSVVACGTTEPEDTVNKYFKSAQSLDLEAMASSILPSNTNDIEETKEMLKEDKDDYTKYFLEYIKKNASKMTYEITDTIINNDKAVVTVNCKYIDGGTLLKATIGEVFKEMFGSLFSGVEKTEEEMDQMYLDILKEQEKSLPETYLEKVIKVEMVKKDNQWYIEEINDDMLDVILSGFITASLDLGKALSE